jgi:hypothetical protein
MGPNVVIKRKQLAPVRNGTLVVRTAHTTVTDLTNPVQQGLLPLPTSIEQGFLGIPSIVFQIKHYNREF